MAKKKYYAVKKGRSTGIFDTWDECKKQVMGYPSASYKSFESLDDAKEFLGEFKKEIPAGQYDVIAYVDGSFDIKTKQFSYGMVILVDGEQFDFYEKFDDVELALMRNVAGEIFGSQKAMEYCLENGYSSLDLYYDYEGIEKWCTGEWKANKDGTKSYKAYYDSIKSKLTVNFNKVKGHSGDKFNDVADLLAKKALGL